MVLSGLSHVAQVIIEGINMSGKFHRRSSQPCNDGVSDPVEDAVDEVVTDDDLVNDLANDPEVIAEHDDGEDIEGGE